MTPHKVSLFSTCEDAVLKAGSVVTGLKDALRGLRLEKWHAWMILLILLRCSQLLITQTRMASAIHDAYNLFWLRSRRGPGSHCPLISLIKDFQKRNCEQQNSYNRTKPVSCTYGLQSMTLAGSLGGCYGSRYAWRKWATPRDILDVLRLH